MAKGFIAGVRDSVADQSDHILDLRDGMDFLNPRQDGIALLKKIGFNKFTARSPKHEWTETELATRRETITIDSSSTALTVANAYQYSVGVLIKCEAEIMRVTAIADATTLTVVRGSHGTSNVAHTSKVAFSVGVAAPENSEGTAAVSDTADRLYNYVQIFERAVELSKSEIMQRSTEGNPLTGQLKRRYIEFMREVAMAMFYGVRNEPAGAVPRRSMGGLTQFITTNVTNVGGALGISAIDAELLKIIEAGGDPKCIVLSPYQKQKLDALDVNKQMLGKKERTGGNLITQTWQSGIMDHELDVFIDHSILKDELWILDTDMVGLGYYEGNGESGATAVVDATKEGQDGKKKVIRAHITAEVEQQKAHARLYGLS